MTDDPPDGVQTKPLPLPLNNTDVITFDTIRGVDSTAPGRRGFVLSAILVAVLLVIVFALLATSSSNSPVTSVRVDAKTPEQALTYLCSRYRTAEAAYTTASANEDYSTGAKTRATFGDELAGLGDPTIAFYTASIRQFTADARDIATQLSESGDIGGRATDDMHRLCAA